MLSLKVKAGTVSFVACLFLFLLYFSFGSPIYNSGDDVYLLYLLDGGFGSGPTNLLHYDSVMHPWLGWVIKTLFIAVPGINWYSVLLYLFHFISCCILLRILLAANRLYMATGIFCILFFVFEAPILLHPTFTNTALITGMTGIILLLRETAVNRVNWKAVSISILLIVISASFRVHLLIPLAAISLPLIAFRLLQKQFVLLYFICLTALAVFLLEYYQQQYYESKIPGWETEELYRASAFSYYNNPKTTDSMKLVTEISFLNQGLFWDKQFLSAAKIQQVKKEIKSPPFMAAKGSKMILYWLFMNSRIFWLSLLIVCIAFIPWFSRPGRIRDVLSLVIMLFVLIWLQLFQKLPFYLIPALILFYILLTTCIPETNHSGIYKVNKWVGILVFTGLVCWGGVRIEKASRLNREKNALFTCSWKELNMHPDKLFVVTNDQFPMDYFAVWDLPAAFPIRNLLYKDQLLNNTYGPVFKRFSITTAKDFANNPDIIFIGGNNSEIKNYYLKVWGIPLHTPVEDKSFHCLEAFRF